MNRDKAWLKEELLRDLMRFNGNPNMTDYESGIASGIMTAINLTEKLDEPEKPVIPKFVADWIEVSKKHYSIGAVFHDAYDGKLAKVAIEEYIFENQDLFARAWLDGYEVEEEKLYYVRAGNIYVRFNLDGSIIGAKKDNSIVCLERLSKLPFDYKKAVESGIITLEEVTQ